MLCLTMFVVAHFMTMSVLHSLSNYKVLTVDKHNLQINSDICYTCGDISFIIF